MAEQATGTGSATAGATAKPAAGGGSSGVGNAKAPRGRMATAKKLEAVLAVLKGDSEDAAARKAGVGVEVVKEWRTTFVAGGEAALRGGKAKATKGGEGREVKWMRQRLGEILIENERLKERRG